MPIRYVVIPGAVEFKDPITGVAIETADSKPDTLSFETFLGRLMHNPLWGESYHGMKAQREVLSAWEKAKAGDAKVMMLAEEDWTRLKQAAEFLKPVGLGYHPALASQLLPLVGAIMEATTTDPLQPVDPPEPSTTTQRIRPPTRKPA